MDTKKEKPAVIVPSIIGGIVGSHVGHLAVSPAIKYHGKKFFQASKMEKPVVTSLFLKKHYPEVNFIKAKDMEEVAKALLPKRLKNLAGRSFSPFTQGRNAAYMHESIMGTSKMSPSVLAHELGHHIDYTKKGPIKFILTPTLIKEYSAWKKAPEILKSRAKQFNVIRRHALSTYGLKAAGGAAGAIAGIIGGLALSKRLLEKRNKNK